MVQSQREAYERYLLTNAMLFNYGRVTDAVNKNSLDVIERSQLLMCLDPPHPGVAAHADESTNALSIVSGRALHGNGMADCSHNRWFDHGIQVSHDDCYTALYMHHFSLPCTCFLPDCSTCYK